jgi:hypothetical protein
LEQIDRDTVSRIGGIIIIDPPIVFTPKLQPPESETVKLNSPEISGVPLILNVSLSQVPLTPEGNPETVAPVAPEVKKTMPAIGLFKQTLCIIGPEEELKRTEFTGLTTMEPVTVFVPPIQPPVSVTI